MIMGQEKPQYVLDKRPRHKGKLLDAGPPYNCLPYQRGA